jgi:hypothetical protein
MFRAPELVRERLLRATQSLQDANVRYAIIGACAVSHYVARKDEGAIRNTLNADVLIDSWAFSTARAALEAVGFVLATPDSRPASFLDGPQGKLRQAVRLWFSGDVLSDTAEPLPSLLYSSPTYPRRMISLPALVRMKVSAWRTIDRVHLQDMVRVGLIDATWPERFPAPLAERLRQILANPDG